MSLKGKAEMETVLGLDLGTNSVGWALVRRSEDTDTRQIAAGVYVFPESAEEKHGLLVSTRYIRGQKRRFRRQLRRKRQRMRSVLHLLVAHGLLPEDPHDREALMSSDRAGGERPYHPMILRAKGLDEELTPYEFGRCIYHIARRRGYMSTRDLIQRWYEQRLQLEVSRVAHLEEAELAEDGVLPASDAKERKEQSKLLARLAEARKRIEAGEARTVGELCAKILLDPEHYPYGYRAGGQRRNGRISKKDPLGWRADRILYEEEFDKLWEAQQRYHPQLLTSDLRDRLRHAIFYQRPLMSKRGLIGRCEFMPHRKRVPRASLIHQRCSVLQKLVNLEVREAPELPERRLRSGEVQTLADELERRDRLSWDEARELLGFGSEAVFSDEAGPRAARPRKSRTEKHRQAAGQGTLFAEPGTETPVARTPRPAGKDLGSSGLEGNKTMAVMRGILGADRWHGFAPEQQEEIVNRLLYAFYPHNVIKGLVRDFGLTTDEVRALASATFPEGYSQHCYRVWRELEPHMRNGLTYWEACVAAGYRKEGETTVKQPEQIVDRLESLPDLRNPVVQRSVKMAFRVINAVIDRCGKPDRIRIEMPRDMSRTNKERLRIRQRQLENETNRKAAAKLLEDNGLPVGRNDENVRKVLLWKEAGCRCPYEPDRPVSLSELVEQYTIEHIVPWSRCWDDSLSNKTICPMGLNLQKGDRTPYEWLGKTDRWPHIEQYVSRLKTMSKAKQRRILQKEWDSEEFTNRALSDTRYISRVVMTEVAKLGVPVEVSRGQLTARLRRVWGLEDCIPEPQTDETRGKAEEQEQATSLTDSASVIAKKKSRADHRHHGLDAIVTALTERSTLQRLSAWYKTKERADEHTASLSPAPWRTLRQDVQKVVKEMPVVFAPNRSVQGALHGEMARKPPDAATVRRALAALPPRRNGRPHKAVVVGKQLVRVREDGTPLAAYDLGNNHHAVIWEKVEPDERGIHRREMTVVPMIEAARRAVEGRPVFDRTPPWEGWRYVMALCKDDIVEWTGERPGWYRVAKFSCGAHGSPDVSLAQLTEAREDRSRRIRIRGRSDLRCLRRRLCLDPLGSVISTEPPDADHR